MTACVASGGRSVPLESRLKLTPGRTISAGCDPSHIQQPQSALLSSDTQALSRRKLSGERTMTTTQITSRLLFTGAFVIYCSIAVDISAQAQPASPSARVAAAKSLLPA